MYHVSAEDKFWPDLGDFLMYAAAVKLPFVADGNPSNFSLTPVYRGARLRRFRVDRGFNKVLFCRSSAPTSFKEGEMSSSSSDPTLFQSFKRASMFSASSDSPSFLC